jgi:hypothetical protein
LQNHGHDIALLAFLDAAPVFGVATVKYRYSITAQEQAAPLIFVIAGTGSSHRGTKMKLLEAAFYGGGFQSLTWPVFQTPGSTMWPKANAT